MPITEQNLNPYYLEKKPVLKAYILYNFNHMIFWERQNYGDGKKHQC